MALAMSRYRLLDLFLGLRSRGRSAILETMPDGVLVLDQEDRIVDFNPAASALLAESYPELLGASMEQVMARSDVSADDDAVGDGHSEIQLGEGPLSRTFDMLASPLGEIGRDGGGRLVVFRDITRRRAAEQAALESERRIAPSSITLTILSSQSMELAVSPA